MIQRIGPIFFWMLLFIPASWLIASFIHNDTLLFISAILALVPIARIIGQATNDIALQTNPTISGLVNATFGNIIELLIAVIALSKGLIAVVQASIIGSIIGNLLLLTGLSIFFGGLVYKEQRFNKTSVGISSTMLIIAVVGLAIPTMYGLTISGSSRHIQIISDAVAIVLAITYISNLIFSLITHKHLFDASDEIKATKHKPFLSIRGAGVILAVCTAFAAIESELLVRSLEAATTTLNLTQTFVGVVLIAIITNVAEKAAAIHFAREDKIDVALEIGLSSAIQVALFVVPILVFVSEIMKYDFFLVFTLFEIIAMVFTVMIVNYLSADGKCNWLEGVQLISVYLIIAIAFFFV